MKRRKAAEESKDFETQEKRKFRFVRISLTQNNYNKQLLLAQADILCTIGEVSEHLGPLTRTKTEGLRFSLFLSKLVKENSLYSGASFRMFARTS